MAAMMQMMNPQMMMQMQKMMQQSGMQMPMNMQQMQKNMVRQDWVPYFNELIFHSANNDGKNARTKGWWCSICWPSCSKGSEYGSSRYYSVYYESFENKEII